MYDLANDFRDVLGAESERWELWALPTRSCVHKKTRSVFCLEFSEGRWAQTAFFFFPLTRNQKGTESEEGSLSSELV